ncbi:MAG: glycosyltransferase family 4 protein [Methylotenera sp.]|nr:glycosyltransferase family 4 protein [Methylotenera sp.]MDZ4222302.1 glycosyltransferase family 4 protein [Methylotenera sp.]
MKRPIHVMMLGLRGFPDVQGGVEKHAENLCPLLVDLGCEVTVLTRSPYQPADVGTMWKGVRFVSLWAPKSKGLEAIVHSFIGVLYAAIKRPDVLHIQAIGPAIVTVFARLLGLRVVVTHHGPDYDRQKWGRFARFVLQLGERWGMRYSNERIVISKVIANLVVTKHGVESALIPNGVILPNIPESMGVLRQFGLERCRYVLLVSRLVIEKRHLDLIGAFKLANLRGWKLVLVGGADHEDAYQLEVKRRASDTGTVMTGFQKGLALQELYAHAGLFVLPSSHEGLPIAMLEALSFGLPVIASDIPANLEVGLPEDCYFRLGSVKDLAMHLSKFALTPPETRLREASRHWVSSKYDWKKIAGETICVYRKAMGTGPI